MNVGDRVVVHDIWINDKRGVGDYYGTIREINNSGDLNDQVAFIEDDFGFRRLVPISMLERY